EVVVHSVIASPGWTGDETLDPKRSLFSELHQGTMAEKVAVPTRNVLPKPADLSFAEAACLPTAWLTAYRMLFVKSGLRPGQTVLVQGASGGVATALVRRGRRARVPDVGDRPQGGEAGCRARAGGGAGVRDRCTAAGAGGWRHGDRRRGHVVAQHQVAQARRRGGDLGSDDRLQPGRRAQPDLLHPAVGHRLDHGYPRGAGVAHRDVPRHRRPAADRRRTAADPGPGRLAADARGPHGREDRLHAVTPVDRVVEALQAGGVDADVRRFDEPVPTAAAAAAGLGGEGAALATSLVFDADGAPLLVLASGAHRVDTGKVAALIGAQRVRRATPEFVFAATGQEVGGVAPVGHPAPLRTV